MEKQVKTPATVKAPAFDAYAKTIIKGYESFDNATAKLSATVHSTMQAYIDVCAKAGLSRDKAGCSALGKAIRECDTVQAIVATGAMEKKTFTEYAQSAMRAFFHGVPFEASLKNNKEMGLPWGNAKPASATPKAGPVENTTIEAAHKTMAKALHQYRAMLQRDFVAELLDVIQAHYPEFDETKE
jgi:hypothetical protein